MNWLAQCALLHHGNCSPSLCCHASCPCPCVGLSSTGEWWEVGRRKALCLPAIARRKGWCGSSSNGTNTGPPLPISSACPSWISLAAGNDPGAEERCFVFLLIVFTFLSISFPFLSLFFLTCPPQAAFRGTRFKMDRENAGKTSRATCEIGQLAATPKCQAKEKCPEGRQRKDTAVTALEKEDKKIRRPTP